MLSIFKFELVRTLELGLVTECAVFTDPVYHGNASSYEKAS